MEGNLTMTRPSSAAPHHVGQAHPQERMLDVMDRSRTSGPGTGGTVKMALASLPVDSTSVSGVSRSMSCDTDLEASFFFRKLALLGKHGTTLPVSNGNGLRCLAPRVPARQSNETRSVTKHASSKKNGTHQKTIHSPQPAPQQRTSHNGTTETGCTCTRCCGFCFQPPPRVRLNFETVCEERISDITDNRDGCLGGLRCHQTSLPIFWHPRSSGWTPCGQFGSRPFSESWTRIAMMLPYLGSHLPRYADAVRAKWEGHVSRWSSMYQKVRGSLLRNSTC